MIVPFLKGRRSVAKKISSEWFEQEFSSIDLGDKRLKDRFLKICNDFNKTPTAIVNHAVEGFHQCKAAYRFWKNNKITSKAFLCAHHKSIKKRLIDNDEYVLELQDSTEINLTSHIKTDELGPIAEGTKLKGLEMHSSVISTEQGLVLGVGSCYLWARDAKNKNKGKDYRQVEWKDKESIKWARALEEVDNIGIDACRRVTVTDREGDFYELLDKFDTEQRKMIIRLRWDRKIEQSNKNVREFISDQPLKDTYEINIASKGGVNPRAERIATIEVRFASVDLLFPKTPKGNLKKIHSVTIIHAKEINPPEGESSIEWYLITNLDCRHIQEAIRIIKCYTKRWLVEEFHKILKGAMKIEDARLGTGGRLEKLIVFLSIFACRILWINRLSRLVGELPCSIAFQEDEWVFVMQRIYKRELKMGEIPTINEIVIGISKLGGYWGRKSDPPPGIIVLWRGIMRLYDSLEAINV